MNASISDGDGLLQGGPLPPTTGGQFEFSPAWMCDRRKIVLDTGAFFARGASQAIVTCLAPALKARHERLFVLAATVQMIAEAIGTASRQPSAKYESAKAILDALEDADAWLCINDPHASEQVEPRQTTTLISDFVMTYQLATAFCVVTQNERLARQLLLNAHSPAIGGVRGVRVAHIDNGRFCDWIPRLERRDGFRPAEAGLEQRIARDYRIIVDTSSLMLLSYEARAKVGLTFFQDRLLPQLLKRGSKMIIPQRVFNELLKHSRQSGDQGSVSKDVLRFLEGADATKAVIRAADEGELATNDQNFADPVLVRAQRFQGEHDICFITQDTALATLLLKNHDPSSGKDYQVVFVTTDGAALGNWERKLLDQANRPSQQDQM